VTDQPYDEVEPPVDGPQNFPEGVEPDDPDDPLWLPDLDEPEEVDDTPPAEFPVPPGDFYSGPDATAREGGEST
jgi:hypothetical protein